MYGCTEAAGKGLKHAFDEVMVVFATGTDVKVATHSCTQ